MTDKLYFIETVFELPQGGVTIVPTIFRRDTDMAHEEFGQLYETLMQQENNNIGKVVEKLITTHGFKNMAKETNYILNPVQGKTGTEVKAYSDHINSLM